jgi:hypothetical protein
VPNTLQIPLERHRDVQRRWQQMLQRTAAANDVRNNYRRAEEDHGLDAIDQRATKLRGLKRAFGSGSRP